ncbi:MAG: hypothetical protein QOH71_1467 [Blastocatellia bacterium]|jgi:hypothetical protein|nr:hypothetical protein [Blastocatellia bacterium]
MVSKDNDAVLSEIREASSLGYSRTAPESIVERLMNANWCAQDDLLLAYQDLQKPDLDRVVAFFQLPFLIRLPDKWIKVKSQYGNPYIRFRPCIDSLETKGGPLNASNGKHERTQVLVSFQLWEIRRQRYASYLETLNDEREFKERVLIYSIMGMEDELEGPSYTAQTYELNVAKRLLLQSIEVLKDFIPMYAVACKDPFAYVPKRLDNFFIMVKNGRVVIRDFNPATPDDPRSSKLLDYSSNLTSLRSRLNLNRKPSIYETYLLEAARQVELGAYNLAIVQTVMILDWFANEIIEDHFWGKVKGSFEHQPELFQLLFERMWETKKDRRIKVSVEDKFTKYLPAIGITLSPKLREDLGRIIDKRNDIVHRTQTGLIEGSIARNAIDSGMEIIKHCMNHLLTLKHHKSSGPAQHTS